MSCDLTSDSKDEQVAYDKVDACDGVQKRVGMDAYKVFWYRPDKPAIAAGGATRFNSLDPLTHLYSYW